MGGMLKGVTAAAVLVLFAVLGFTFWSGGGDSNAPHQSTISAARDEQAMASAETVTAEDTVPVAAPADPEISEIATLTSPALESTEASDEPQEPTGDEGAPSFDLVRVSPEGQVVIAGQAQPNSEVSVVIDGEVAGSAEADESGAFVAILDAGASDQPRQIVLSAPNEEGADTAADPQPAPEESVGDTPEGATILSTDEGVPGNTATSAPIIILPTADDQAAPVLVKAAEDGIAVIQPAASPQAQELALDRITYETGGDVVAAGRGSEDSAVRAYADGELVAETPVAGSGGWQATIPRGAVEDASLLRFDEVSGEGDVTARLEAPFEYSSEGAVQHLRRRELIVERGNNLWRIAEQHYGDGIRYSLIFGANSGLIRNPDLIYPGQVFSIPELVEAE